MTTKPLVLAVDDETGMLRLLKLELGMHGFRVLTTSDPAEALTVVEEQRPDVVLLDIGMPEKSGIELMQEIRELRDIPVIIVSAMDRDRDKVGGLESGADDYLTKPFSAKELAARIRAVMRRQAGVHVMSQPLQVDGLEVDLAGRTVKRDGQEIQLTRTEWMLLETLAARPGTVVPNADILSRVWGSEYRDDLQYLRVWVSRLRQKIEADASEPSVVLTMPGLGYRFNAEGFYDEGRLSDEHGEARVATPV